MAKSKKNSISLEGAKYIDIEVTPSSGDKVIEISSAGDKVIETSVSEEKVIDASQNKGSSTRKKTPSKQAKLGATSSAITNNTQKKTPSKQTKVSVNKTTSSSNIQKKTSSKQAKVGATSSASTNNTQKKTPSSQRIDTYFKATVPSEFTQATQPINKIPDTSNISERKHKENVLWGVLLVLSGVIGIAVESFIFGFTMLLGGLIILFFSYYEPK